MIMFSTNYRNTTNYTLDMAKVTKLLQDTSLTQFAKNAKCASLT